MYICNLFTFQVSYDHRSWSYIYETFQISLVYLCRHLQLLVHVKFYNFKNLKNTMHYLFENYYTFMRNEDLTLK